jgi:hypothetical protein
MDEDIKSSYLSVDKAICDLLPDFIGAKKYDEWVQSKTVYYPSIFENPEDAHEFKRLFLKNTKDIYVVKLGVLLNDSLCILDEMLDSYAPEELGISQILKRKREIPFQNLPILGYDIMGYENATFTSFRTNHLIKDVRAHAPFQTNDVGLISNFYDAQKGALLLNEADFGQEELHWFPWCLILCP